MFDCEQIDANEDLSHSGLPVRDDYAVSNRAPATGANTNRRQRMQYGSISKESRKSSPDVWSYRWWESGPNGKRIHRRLVIGSVTRFQDELAAIEATAALRTEINSLDPTIKPTPMTLAQLAEHFRQRELTPDRRGRVTPPGTVIRFTYESGSFRSGANVLLLQSKPSRWSTGSGNCRSHPLPARS